MGFHYYAEHRDHTLVMKSERGATYQIDLETKAITQFEAACSAAPNVIAHSPDIPRVIDRAIANESLAKNYLLSHRMNPFYLRGDFNGDGKIDVAVLIKQGSMGKIGIAIINGANDKITIVGAGPLSAMAVMTLSGWIPGRSTPRTN